MPNQWQGLYVLFLRGKGLLALHFQVTVLHWRKSISNLKPSLFSAPHSITLNQRIHSQPQKYSRNHGRITLAGSLIASRSADFLTQPRTCCPRNSPAHSRQGPSVSINNQANGPQSCTGQADLGNHSIGAFLAGSF